jgi:hypothetical protein
VRVTPKRQRRAMRLLRGTLLSLLLFYVVVVVVVLFLLLLSFIERLEQSSQTSSRQTENGGTHTSAAACRPTVVCFYFSCSVCDRFQLFSTTKIALIHMYFFVKKKVACDGAV